MVGRERELAKLRQTFASAIGDRSCQLFTILGTAGSGSPGWSRSSSVRSERQRSSGAAASRTARDAFFPVGEVLKEGPAWRTSTRRTRSSGRSRGAGTDGPACSTLAQLFAAADRDSSVEETFWAVRSFLEAVAETAPLAVVFDDIHWGEPTFLDLIEHITGWAREAPILVLCVARPELLDERAGWGRARSTPRRSPSSRSPTMNAAT